MANLGIPTKASKLLGEPVVDAVAVARLPKWRFVFFVALVAMIMLRVNLLVMALIAGLVGLAITLGSDYKIIARTSNRLVLLSARALFSIRPTTVDRELRSNDVVVETTAGLKKTVAVDGHRYTVPRAYCNRLLVMLGRTT